jgi:hypothetical protein
VTYATLLRLSCLLSTSLLHLAHIHTHLSSFKRMFYWIRHASAMNNVPYLNLLNTEACCLFALVMGVGQCGVNRKNTLVPMVILSPSDSAMPCVLLRMRTWPVIEPDSKRSMLRLASASSPLRNHKRADLRREGQDIPNRLRAYRLADKKSESPAMAPSGVRQDMFVDFMICFKYSRGSLAKCVNGCKR